ncbi:hypothetical protein CHUAL_001254 [Chamberlinius hualienensis]
MANEKVTTIIYFKPSTSKLPSNNLTKDLEILRKCCRPLLILIQLVGLKIEFSDDQRKCNVIQWFIRIFLLVAASYNFALQSYVNMNGFGTDDLWVLTFSDHFSVFAFIYIFSIRGRKISKFIIETLKISLSNQTYSTKPTSIRHIRRKVLILSVMPFVMTLSAPAFVYYIVLTTVNCEEWFTFYYFGIKTTPTLRGIISAISDSNYNLMLLIVQIYGSFIIMIIHVIGIGYENLNRSFSQLKFISMKNINKFQEEHYTLNEICNQFNQLFSPAITVYVCMQMLQIMGTTGNIISQFTIDSQQPNQHFAIKVIFWFNVITPPIRSFYVILLLLKTTHNLHQQSRKVFDSLLNISFKNPQLYDISENGLFKHCSRTILFSTQWLVSPTTINASGLFTIDYTLLGVVLSITVTYWACVGQMKNDFQLSSILNFTC